MAGTTGQEPAQENSGTIAPDLSKLLGFSHTDLLENREGRLSPDQLRMVRSDLRSEGVAVALIFAGALAGVMIHAVVVAILAPVFGVMYFFKWIQKRSEMRAGGVLTVVGDAWTEAREEAEVGERYWLHIAGLKLEIGKRAVYTAIRPGGPYRVFYYPAMNYPVVGAEALPGWRPSPLPVPRHR